MPSHVQTQYYTGECCWCAHQSDQELCLLYLHFHVFFVLYQMRSVGWAHFGKKRDFMCVRHPSQKEAAATAAHMVRSSRCHLNFKLSPWIKSLLFLSPWALHRILNLFLSPHQPLPGFNLLCVVIYDTAAGNSSIYHVCMRLLILLLPNIINGVIFWGQLNVKIDF